MEIGIPKSPSTLYGPLNEARPACIGCEDEFGSASDRLGSKQQYSLRVSLQV